MTSVRAADGSAHTRGNRGVALVPEAWLAMIVPVAVMAGALGMQRLEHYLLGPVPEVDADPWVGRDVTAQSGSATSVGVQRARRRP
jgi:hypothetical protein